MKYQFYNCHDRVGQDYAELHPELCTDQCFGKIPNSNERCRNIVVKECKLENCHWKNHLFCKNCIIMDFLITK